MHQHLYSFQQQWSNFPSGLSSKGAVISSGSWKRWLRPAPPCLNSWAQPLTSAQAHVSNLHHHINYGLFLPPLEGTEDDSVTTSSSAVTLNLFYNQGVKMDGCSPGGWPGRWCRPWTRPPAGTWACLQWPSQNWPSAWPGSYWVAKRESRHM